MNESTEQAPANPGAPGGRVRQRTCVGCRRSVPDLELLRHVLRSGRVVPDPARRLPGRGAWLHPGDACLDLALRRGGFARSFRATVDTTAIQPPATDEDQR